VRNLRMGLFLVLAVTLMAGCANERDRSAPTAPVGAPPNANLDPVGVAADIARQAGWAIEIEEPSEGMIAPSLPVPGGDKALLMQRQVLVGNIVHYSIRVRVGPGAHDVFGLHRVVREARPYQPIRTSKSVFLQHGDLKDFTGMFLPGAASPRLPDDYGLAVQLAQSDLDVWGIDQAWTLVPNGLGDYSFLLDFGLDRCISDLTTGIEIARVTRWLTGNGYRQMALLGYSSGAALGFAYLNEQTQRPQCLQQTCAFVPVDYGLKGDVESWFQALRQDMVLYESLIESGYNRQDNPFGMFGPPALADPDGPSELIPGLTNRQAAIAVAAFPAYSMATYHFLAGVFDADGMPADLQYTRFDNWVEFMLASPPHETVAFMRDYSMTALPEYDTVWDDHLAAITTPILYLNAIGGGGAFGLHTLDLISSTDVTVRNFGFHPPEEILLDFGHIDLFLAEGAADFVWAPTKDWIVTHTP
jgi:hypothetical protein